MPATQKKLSMKQLVASLAVEADAPMGEPVYVIRTPRANEKHNSKEPEKCICYGCQRDSGRGMYGVYFTDGVAIVTDAVAKENKVRYVVNEENGEHAERPMTGKELAEKIVAEFPDYTMEVLA